jgi:transposase
MKKETLIPLIAEGLSQREIAARLNKSQGSVRYWLKQYELKTSLGQRNQKYFNEEDKKNARQKRSVIHVAKYRQKTRLKAIDLLGGKCEICEYNKCSQALEFHHKEPSTKLFGLTATNMGQSWKKIETEVLKCRLLCANCHRELHQGLVD